MDLSTVGFSDDEWFYTHSVCTVLSKLTLYILWYGFA